MRNKLFGHVLFFISVLFWGTHCFASDMKIDIRDVKTSAGIGYWYKQKEGLPLVSMTMAFKNAGFIYDPIDKKGLALLATSLISRGTTKDGESIAKLFQEKGIIFHVSVDSDNAYVTLKTLSENLDFALGLIGEVLVDSPIDEEVFVIEKERQKSDIRRDASDPGQLAHNMLNKVVFGDQPHAYDASGTLDALEGVTIEDVENYRRENFDLDKLVIGVVGNASEEDVSRMLDGALARLGRGQNSKVIGDAVLNIGLRGYVAYDSPQSVIVFAANSIPRKDPKYHVAEVLSSALGGMGLSSVLMQELREKLGITYNVRSGLYNVEGASLFQGILFTDKTTARKGVEAFLRTVQSVKEKGLDKRALEIARAKLVSSTLFSLSRTSSMSQVLVYLQLHGFSADIHNYSARYESVTLEEVNEFAKNFLGDFTIVEVGAENNIDATITS
ncbi:peptidase M16 inactive domain protein [Anaplasma phagocytophilum str. ApMUC09]|uniref:Peptidase M16 inactive domain protein n=1 Tax=Anaplasma phagocytophilum str. ApMUC09 TaxID=1359152 RepID=A0A0F3NB74_ANAPH|nr:peptidase M16 inactive domain protein [Anaplasma phagocytophilum str. ApMUC09]SCV65440.1 Peptidase M16 inactive domain protein [Anaplasma phagocytophilum]